MVRWSSFGGTCGHGLLFAYPSSCCEARSFSASFDQKLARAASSASMAPGFELRFGPLVLLCDYYVLLVFPRFGSPRTLLRYFTIRFVFHAACAGPGRIRPCSCYSLLATYPSTPHKLHTYYLTTSYDPITSPRINLRLSST